MLGFDGFFVGNSSQDRKTVCNVMLHEIGGPGSGEPRRLLLVPRVSWEDLSLFLFLSIGSFEVMWVGGEGVVVTNPRGECLGET